MKNTVQSTENIVLYNFHCPEVELEVTTVSEKEKSGCMTHMSCLNMGISSNHLNDDKSLFLNLKSIKTECFILFDFLTTIPRSVGVWFIYTSYSFVTVKQAR